jgi:hypothetical protein
MPVHECTENNKRRNRPARVYLLGSSRWYLDDAAWTRPTQPGKIDAVAVIK